MAGGDWLTCGRVGRPHGLDGSFHVAEPRPELIVLGAEVRVGGRDAEIVRRAGTDERPIVRLAGFEGRSAAEALRGEALLVPLVRDAIRMIDVEERRIDVDLAFLGEER